MKKGGGTKRKWITEKESTEPRDINISLNRELYLAQRHGRIAHVSAPSASEKQEAFWTLPRHHFYKLHSCGTSNTRLVICSRCNNNSRLTYDITKPGEFRSEPGKDKDREPIWLCRECHRWKTVETEVPEMRTDLFLCPLRLAGFESSAPTRRALRPRGLVPVLPLAVFTAPDQ